MVKNPLHLGENHALLITLKSGEKVRGVLRHNDRKAGCLRMEAGDLFFTIAHAAFESASVSIAER